MIINPSSWFEKLLETGEKRWLLDGMPLDKISDIMGDFNTYSISVLKSRMSKVPISNINISNIPLFKIFIRKEYTPDNQKYFDTSSLQILLPQLDGVPNMFQVASNFNCCENGSVLKDIKDGNFLTGLMTDTTQGPSASAGAGAGAILRLHKQNINLLDDTNIHVSNGKIMDYALIDDIDKIKIGLHTSLRANYDRSIRNKCVYYSHGTLIDQVFTSTVALSKKQATIPKYREMADRLLDAAYRGTYLSAIYRGSRKLVLTLIGGGVFNNPKGSIARAIAASHIEYSKYSRLQEVILPLYEEGADPLIYVEALLAAGYPKNKIKITKI